MAVTAYDTGEEKNGNRTTDSSAWSIETDGPHVATVEASARTDVTARAKNAPILSIANPIAPAARASDERTRPPPCIPDTVSFDFAIPISSLVPEIRFLRFFCGLTTTATLDDSAPRQSSDAPRLANIAYDAVQYRWEGDSGKGICRADDVGRCHLDFLELFQKPYGAMICVL